MEIVIDISMNGDDFICLYAHRRNRTRHMRCLCEQIKADYADCIQLREKLKMGTISRSEERDFLKILSWLRREVDEFQRLKQKGMEGVLWGRLENIKWDLNNMENKNIIDFWGLPRLLEPGFGGEDKA